MARQKDFSSDFRHFFGRGLAILLPSIVTLWILWQAFVFLLNNVAEPINVGLRAATVWAVPYFINEEKPPEWFRVTNEQVRARVTRMLGELPDDPQERAAVLERRRPEVIRLIRRERLGEFWKSQWYLQIVGLLIAVLLVYLAGLLLGNFFGKQIYVRVERLIARIPGFKQVYPHVKQLVELVLGEKALAFSTVVLVEYPSKDIWTMGFLTGNSFGQIGDAVGDDVVSVFIPTSPTPFTGFTINVSRASVRILDVPIDQALRFVITAGVLTPDQGDRASLRDAHGGPDGTEAGEQASTASS
ncbi:MAG: DUF502 domain-containing protein [Planctomycetota bacterium]|nr:MAG: DUF502 domain-containing protein [Planctomycetota bacterium]